ncbi:MAG: Protein translocase subunit SecA [candidate division CPR1 bacterium GW2011_GWA2_42_17]|uniref:Protein translocase subunit SecA n=1 Tax=candidate division CPR1 bacterium GW2011_GWA2_42_17 TaxID=1618341 RepID=A0A0G1BCQ6_9BACT|nr:MAG: Protein translocase subunit SecA [candidate division CPR1 bacterium GW2011_GWA2_42_17]
MLGFLKNIFDSNEKEVKRYLKTVAKINALEHQIQKLSDDELRLKTVAFKSVVAKEMQDYPLSEYQAKPRYYSVKLLEPVAIEALAVVREGIRRTVGERAFDVQLVAALALHEGKIAEQKTGEGKTLSSVMAMYLNGLTGLGVHLVTVNDYLAQRDAGWYGKALDFLGLKVGVIIHDQSFIYDPSFDNPQHSDERLKHHRPVSRQEAYNADVTYGTNNEYGFDYLRDNMVYQKEQKSQRGHNFAIVDEVDSILIDEARTPLIISAPAQESNELYQKFSKIVPSLNPQDYILAEKEKSIHLSDLGIKKMEKVLGIANLFDDWMLTHHLDQALKANFIYLKDRDYIVKDNEVIIVDEFTGRLMPGRRFSEGLHQAIEAKEKVTIQKESKTLATITFQNYFRLYQKLAGMTGTAATESEEFHKIYDLEVVVVPTNKTMIRVDQADRIYKHQRAKWKAIVDEIEECHKKGQPVLVGTTSVEKNELLHSYLDRRGIPHEILNAKNHEREAEIIVKAGLSGSVTVATNMAGRGTDIRLGLGVVELGGLHVIGTERHEARRIDNQPAGRFAIGSRHGLQSH